MCCLGLRYILDSVEARGLKKPKSLQTQESEADAFVATDASVKCTIIQAMFSQVEPFFALPMAWETWQNGEAAPQPSGCNGTRFPSFTVKQVAVPEAEIAAPICEVPP